MIYSVLNLTAKSIGDIIPEYLRRKIDEKAALIFAAIDDEENDRIIAVACFSDTEASYFKVRVILETVYVIPEYRLEGVGKELLTYAFSFLKRRGITGVFCKTLGSEADILNYYGFLTECGFVPITLSGRLATYDMDVIRNNESISKMLMAAGKDKHFTSINDVDSVMYRRFLAQIRNSGMDAYYYDPSVSGFYVTDREIIAATFAKKLTDNNLFLESAYCNHGLVQPKVIAATCMASVCTALKIMPKDTEITLQYTDEKAYSITVDILGEPKNVIMFQEFLKPL